MHGTSVKRDKPVMLLARGKRVVRRVDNIVGRGGGKKQTLACNQPDRDGKHHLTRKRADFPLVFERESM
jgi:hypothetical protein